MMSWHSLIERLLITLHPGRRLVHKTSKLVVNTSPITTSARKYLRPFDISSFVSPPLCSIVDNREGVTSIRVIACLDAKSDCTAEGMGNRGL